MKYEPEHSDAAPRLIYYPEVRRLTGLSRSTVWKLEKAGQFPKRRLITSHRVAWLEGDIHAWIMGRAEVEGAEIKPQHNLPQKHASAPNTSTRPTLTQGPIRRPSWMDRDDD
jgi:prophage regulatory protein